MPNTRSKSNPDKETAQCSYCDEWFKPKGLSMHMKNCYMKSSLPFFNGNGNGNRNGGSWCGLIFSWKFWAVLFFMIVLNKQLQDIATALLLSLNFLFGLVMGVL